MFQSTRPRGARLVLPLAPLPQQMFQSTRPRGARRDTSRRLTRLRYRFNPRARVGRDKQGRHDDFACSFRFNPRARVGRDFNCRD